MLSSEVPLIDLWMSAFLTQTVNADRIKKLTTFTAIMDAVGVKHDSVGCEVCKPAIGSILSSLFNEHIMNPAHHA